MQFTDPAYETIRSVERVGEQGESLPVTADLPSEPDRAAKSAPGEEANAILQTGETTAVGGRPDATTDSAAEGR